jgi:ribosomal-protein-alanine N-acetyltransferase
MVVLSTERLTLRHLEPADLPALHALCRDPEVRRYFPDGTLTLGQTRAQPEWFRHGHPHHPSLGLWATIETRSSTFLGRCGLLPWTLDGVAEVELAFLIDRARWGEGLATEAARGIIQHAREVLRLSRLICLVMPGNEAAARVARKVGMRFEREHVDALGACWLFALDR